MTESDAGSCSRRVCIVYRRPVNWLDSMIQTVGRTGEFCHCELWFPDWVHQQKPGWRFTNFMFQPMEMNADAWMEYSSAPDLYAAQTVWVRTPVYRALLEWYRARVVCNTQYNYASVMRMVLPHCLSASTDPVDTPGMRLFCSEAIVMAFRHATATEASDLSDAFNRMVACSTKPVQLASGLVDVGYEEPQPISQVVRSRVLLSEE